MKEDIKRVNEGSDSTKITTITSGKMLTLSFKK